jgi:hypothetical protein
MAKLQKKKTTPTFFFGVCEMENPPFEFEICTTLFKILPQNWTTLSHDDALSIYLSRCFRRGMLGI